MQENNKPSFFDDDDQSFRFEFRRPEDKDKALLSAPPTLKDNLSKSSQNSGNKQSGIFSLHGTLLAHFKTTGQNVPDAVLELAHSKMKPIEANDGVQGFTVTKNGSSFDFYAPDNKVGSAWVDALKGVCVLLTFHDEYKAIKMIGRGSFAKVYYVESKTNGKAYAVKAFTKESIFASNKANAKPSMLNEIDIMRSLEHDNIIKLYEVYETEKSIYLVLELISGKSLQDTLKKSSWKAEASEIKVINMIRSIVDALAYMAAKGLMHRDLKPDNILVDKGDKIKIVDFGLGTKIDVPEYIFKKCGTPGYIAPEVFKYDQKVSTTHYNHRCDVFSAGCILFFMLFGYPFFDQSDADEILRANRKFTADYEGMGTIKSELKDTNSKISKDGLDLCFKMCEFDQKKRLTAAQCLQHQYFIPIPSEMNKVQGEYQTLERQNSYSPKSTSPNGSFKLLEHKDSIQSNTSTGKDRTHRFTEKDSLYLDMGKPDLNGKINTMNTQSQNNSILLQRGQTNDSSQNSRSSFSGSPKMGPGKQVGKEFKNQPGNSAFLKAAIFKNMEKNNNDETKEEDDEVNPHLIDRRNSDSGGRSPQQLDTRKRNESQSPEGYDDILHENSGVAKNVNKINNDSSPKHPSKMATTSQNRRYIPFQKS